MLSRVLPSARELFIATVAVLLALTVTNLVRPAEAGDLGPTTDFAFVATGENFPDALGAAAVAGAVLAPVLLVQQNSVPQPTLDELNRLTPDQIIIVGGTAVISDGVRSTLEALSFAPAVTRVAGANRYDTAATLSNAAFPSQGYYPLAAYSGGAQGKVVDATAPDEVVRSVTLTAPVDGTVIVNSTAYASDSDVAATQLRCSITTGTSTDSNFLQIWESPGGEDGNIGQLAGTRGFDVSAGEFTANLVCVAFPSGSGLIGNSAMTAIFVADI